MSIVGLHHITLVCSQAQRTVDFYTGVLGLRLVKQTVNFDDPGSYHLYFGDELGRPGSAITFFEWPGAPRGGWGIGGTHHFAGRIADHLKTVIPAVCSRYSWEQNNAPYPLPQIPPVSHARPG